jgi:hypothetical protein
MIYFNYYYSVEADLDTNVTGILVWRMIYRLMYFEQIICKDLGWISLNRNGSQWRVFVNPVNDLQVS